MRLQIYYYYCYCFHFFCVLNAPLFGEVTEKEFICKIKFLVFPSEGETPQTVFKRERERKRVVQGEIKQTEINIKNYKLVLLLTGDAPSLPKASCQSIHNL